MPGGRPLTPQSRPSPTPLARHAAYWQPRIESGRMVVFGPVLGSWGLGVVEADDEEELRAFAAGDPVVTTGTLEVGKMLGGFIRPQPDR